MSEIRKQRPRILFVCFGNTCRSVFAEYIARFRFGNLLEAASAGIKPQDAADAASAIETLRNMGIDASNHVPRGLSEVDPASFDRVVAMKPSVASKVKEQFPLFPHEQIFVWNVKDPWGDNPVAYKGCADSIFAQLKRFVGLSSGSR